MRTTARQIVDYWASRQAECGLSVDWSEAEERCWRCAHESRLHRCHIVPGALGGSDAPANLVLLCGRCHREAPNVADPDFMWEWLRAAAVTSYDTYWTLRGYEEFEKIYGRHPFTGLKEDPPKERTEALIRSYLRKTTIHIGEGGLNPATFAWCFRQVEKELSKEGLMPSAPGKSPRNTGRLDRFLFNLRTEN